ncbi:MAG TPA: D-alanyl-D-alanine carboxypeptidase, partial [Clostridia bacterium]|nr:D-alanyl-D-alanine carboxypeptidase [Clostridia bacterium]
KSDEIGLVKTEISLPKSLKAPVAKGTEIGEIKFVLNGNTIASSKLISGESVRRKVFADYLGDIFTAWGRLIKSN